MLVIMKNIMKWGEGFWGVCGVICVCEFGDYVCELVVIDWYWWYNEYMFVLFVLYVEG